jgi:hypothetical protein
MRMWRLPHLAGACPRAGPAPITRPDHRRSDAVRIPFAPPMRAFVNEFSNA